MAGLFGELKRRNVVRVGVAYVVVGWIVVQIAQLLFEAFGTPDWVIKTVIVLIAIGLPFALIFAWAFELTPEGLKRTHEVARAESITWQTGRKLNYVITAALVVALGYFIWERQGRDDATTTPLDQVAQGVDDSTPAAANDSAPSRRSVAVLPFVNMSSDEDQQWFADGLTEEILNSLVKTPDLLVTARTSSFAYKGSSQPIPVIAAELGVGHILEGSVRRGGDTLRITAQLVRADDGFHLWSQTFDRSMSDIIAVQEEIAVQIAKALKTSMDPEALQRMMNAGTTSVPAYEAYLTGMGILSAADESGDVYENLKARDAFEKAIELDPGFAQAHWRLAQFWWIQSQTNQMFSGTTDLSRQEIEANRDEAVRNAISFEKDEPTKLKYRAAQAEMNLDFQLARRLITDYMGERPNDESALGEYLGRYAVLGLYDDIAAIIEDRYTNYEFSRDAGNAMLVYLRAAGASELMGRIAQDATDRYGTDMSLMYQAHRVLLWANDVDGARRLVPRLLNSDLPTENRLLVELRQACGEQRITDAKELYNEALKNHDGILSVVWLVHVIMGEDEAAAALFDDYDAESDFATISSYLNYVHFDAARYSNFMSAVAGQGIEKRPILELPYRCDR